MSMSCNKSKQDGFSLVEMIIAMTIFLVVMAAIFGVLRVGNMARSTINDSSETVNNARISVNSVGRDAINAGLGYSRVGGVVPDDLANTLLGLPQDSGDDRDLFTAVISGDEVSTSSISVAGEKNDVVAFMFRDLDFNAGNPIVITGTAYTNDQVDLLTPANGCVLCNKWDLYLVESANGNHALGIATDIISSNSGIRFEKTDPLNLNKKTNGNKNKRSILTPCGTGETSDCFSYTPQATVKRVFLTSYSVDSNGTLIRKTFGNNTGGTSANQIQETPLADGVEHFQVRYLMQDGTFTSDPSNGTADQGNMNEVIQVEVAIRIKPSSTGVQTITTQRINLTSTFSTRNIKYDVE